MFLFLSNNVISSAISCSEHENNHTHLKGIGCLHLLLLPHYHKHTTKASNSWQFLMLCLDNDTMIGNKNSVKAPRPSALKNHHSVQSRHAQCKVASSQAVDDSRLNTRKSKDTTDTNLKGKKWSTTAISSRRRNITTDKPRSVRIS